MQSDEERIIIKTPKVSHKHLFLFNGYIKQHFIGIDTVCPAIDKDGFVRYLPPSLHTRVCRGLDVQFDGYGFVGGVSSDLFEAIDDLVE